MSGGDTPPPADMDGKGFSVGYGPAPIVYAGDFGDALCLTPFPAGTWTNGEIVVCDRGQIARVAKGYNVLQGGAGGYVLANADASSSLNGDVHHLPGLQITFDDGVILKDWLATGANHMATISGTTISVDAGNADLMAGFSSRGPLVNNIPEIVKPDVTAPGVDILAAYRSNPPDPDNPTSEYGIISGTSMSSPHTAGAAALMRALYPSWSAAEIKSAIMSTGVTAGVVKEDGTTPADPFDIGGGRVWLSDAGHVGLVLDIPLGDFQAADPGTGGDPRTLNLASMGDPDCSPTCSWTRTLGNTQDFTLVYSATLILPAGVTGTVTPDIVTIASGATEDVTIDLDASGAPIGTWLFAELKLEPVPPARAPEDIDVFVSNPALAIPDDGYDGTIGTMACDTIDASTLPGGNTIDDVEVELGVDHTWTGDLVTKLYSPDVSVLGLFSRAGFAEPADDGTDCCGDSSNLSAAASISFGDAYVDDAETMGDTILGDAFICAADGRCEYFPNPDSVIGHSAFSGFAGENASGDWQLCIGDSASGDDGTFQSWTLTLTHSGDGDGELPDQHLPIAIVNSGGEPDIDVDPASISSTQNSNTITDHDLDISNVGAAQLDWSIYEDNSNSPTSGPWSENFDSYPIGTDLHGVGDWKGWGNEPTATAFTTDTQSLSAPASVDIVTDADLVHEYTVDSGSWTYTAWQFVPDDFTGDSFFILLNQYDDAGATNNWSTQVHFNAASGQVVADGVGALFAPLPLVTDQWVELRVEIDLTNDWQRFYYDDQLLFEGSWSDGVSGGGILAIGAVDLYANGASSVYYDDLSLLEGIPCDAPEDILWASVAPDNGSTAPGNTDTVVVTFDSTGVIAGTYEGTLCVESNDPDEPVVPVPLTMIINNPTGVTLTDFGPDRPAAWLPAFVVIVGLVLSIGAGLLLKGKRHKA
jgi:subtilisin-like proprotein convertase family protein